MNKCLSGLLFFALTSTVGIIAQQAPKEVIVSLPVSKLGYFGRISAGTYDLLSRAIAPFQGGYRHTEEQKEAASKLILVLEEERKQIIDQMKSKDDMLLLKFPYLFIQPLLYPQIILRKYTSQDVIDLFVQFKEIDQKIYDQKVITGQAWSRQRKIALGTIALLGAAILGFGAYRYFHVGVDPIDA